MFPFDLVGSFACCAVLHCSLYPFDVFTIATELIFLNRAANSMVNMAEVAMHYLSVTYFSQAVGLQLSSK